MQLFKVDRTWEKVHEEYAEFPLSHLDRKLYKNWGSIRDRLSINQDQLDDMDGKQDNRAALLVKVCLFGADTRKTLTNIQLAPCQ